MTNKIVIGLAFGDEGKGITTDFLCSQMSDPLVSRFSGGQQAGHTVLHNGIRHVFSNFGSGSLREVPTYWSRFCTADPIGITNEFIILKEKGISPILFIDEMTPITTPYDTYLNIKDSINLDNGSCGVGVGKTFEREENFYSLTFGDIFNEWIFENKLNSIKQYYYHKYNIPISKIKLDRFMECCKFITNNKNITPKNNQPFYQNNVYEGSQGLLLDQHIGFFPHVTRSNTGSKNINLLSNVSTSMEPLQFYLVTRAYQTRHGNGPMSNEKFGHNIKLDKNETNVKNKYQGEFRRTLLDVNLLEYGIKRDPMIAVSQNKTLVITCLDHIVNEYRFTYNNELILCNDEDDFVQKIGSILNIKNILLSHSADSSNFKTITI